MKSNERYNASNYLELVRCIYKDACAKCIADVSDLRDLETIRSRVKDEGISFLTITLPNFARDFERCLELGYVDSSCFKNFEKHGSIPAFLQGMTSLIFDRETGRIYDKTRNICSDRASVVDSIRQICLTFKKLRLECTPARVRSSLHEFVKIEQAFKEFVPPDEDVSTFRRISSMLWDNLLADIDRLDELYPKHGPGATAEKISGNRKYLWRYWYERLEPYFPFIDNAYSINVVGRKEFKKVTFIPPEKEFPVRVTPVPKTLKGPRIIAIEPVCMQYVQQAIQRVLVKTLESSKVVGGQINFTDQSINQRLALIASGDKQLATIDLSEASDRVPRSLALDMFSSHPDLRDAIDACRSTHAVLPDGTIIGPLMKFASMGSSLCFPVESMYFYTICVATLLREQNLPETFGNIKTVCRQVYVYGDDIIVPSTYADAVLVDLQKYNCKVNMSKTFINGSFRESCGMDAFEGERVTPIYLREACPENRRQSKILISWVKSANLFYEKGYWRTAQHMFNIVERYLGPLPYVIRESSGLGRVSFLGYRSVERWNDKLHRFEVKCWTPSPIYRKDRIWGYAALMKSLLNLPFIKDDDSRDKKHLARTALHDAVTLKRRWIPVN